MSCEGEGERDFLFKWLWGPDDQIRKIETPCPEYPDQWPEYPGVTEPRQDLDWLISLSLSLSTFEKVKPKCYGGQRAPVMRVAVHQLTVTANARYAQRGCQRCCDPKLQSGSFASGALHRQNPPKSCTSALQIRLYLPFLALIYPYFSLTMQPALHRFIICEFF